MCKFCENHASEDRCVYEYQKPLFDNGTTMVSLRSSNPISRKKSPNYSGFLDIARIWDTNNYISIPIRFCPMCGRKL